MNIIIPLHLFLYTGDSMDMEGESTLTQAMRRFTGAEQKAPSLEIVKGALLATADNLLSTL